MRLVTPPMICLTKLIDLLKCTSQYFILNDIVYIIDDLSHYDEDGTKGNGIYTGGKWGICLKVSLII